MLGMTSIPNEFSRRLWDRTLLSGIRHQAIVIFHWFLGWFPEP